MAGQAGERGRPLASHCCRLEEKASVVSAGVTYVFLRDPHQPQIFLSSLGNYVHVASSERRAVKRMIDTCLYFLVCNVSFSSPPAPALFVTFSSGTRNVVVFQLLDPFDEFRNNDAAFVFCCRASFLLRVRVAWLVAPPLSAASGSLPFVVVVVVVSLCFSCFFNCTPSNSSSSSFEIIEAKMQLVN